MTVQLNIANNGHLLTFDTSNATAIIDYRSTISGTGSVVKNGPGILNFEGSLRTHTLAEPR